MSNPAESSSRAGSTRASLHRPLDTASARARQQGRKQNVIDHLFLSGCHPYIGLAVFPQTSTMFWPPTGEDVGTRTGTTPAGTNSGWRTRSYGESLLINPYSDAAGALAGAAGGWDCSANRVPPPRRWSLLTLLPHSGLS